jgi:hypothetical protein
MDLVVVLVEVQTITAVAVEGALLELAVLVLIILMDMEPIRAVVVVLAVLARQIL